MEEATPLRVVWASISGWLTPAFLFLLLNLVIGTIALTSRKSYKNHHQQLQQQQQQQHPFPRALSRGASMLTRLASFNFNQYRYGFDDAPIETAAVVDEEENNKEEETRENKAAAEEEKNKKTAAAAEEEKNKKKAAAVEEDAAEGEEVLETLEDAYRNFRRSQSAETISRNRALGGRGTPAMRKAASEKATEKKIKAKVEEEEEEEKEVDARADDFINRFRKQLQLQRLESLLRRRGPQH